MGLSPLGPASLAQAHLDSGAKDSGPQRSEVTSGTKMAALKEGLDPTLSATGRIPRVLKSDSFAAGNPIAGARFRGEIFGAQQSAEIPPNADLRKS